MVMMQSPNSDTPKSASPLNSTPCSPINPHAKTTSIDQQLAIKFEPIVIERPQPTKFDGLLLGSFHHDKDDTDMKNRPLTYPKDMCDIDANTKFSLERLKQLSNRTLYNRQSPSDDSNHSPKYPIGTKINDNTSPRGKKPEHDLNPSNVNLNHKALHIGAGAATILPTQPYPIDMDIERLKLARHVANGKEFTDFGFRIQLSEFHSDYAQSDTSEELVVDEKSEMLPLRDSTTVGFIYCLCPYNYGGLSDYQIDVFEQIWMSSADLKRIVFLKDFAIKRIEKIRDITRSMIIPQIERFLQI